ncbi:MAG: hypothetical protein E6470_22120 [Enterobacteriaceae bacterium]|uniref:hypothetical protein n=1 Tax=Kosakonia sp. R1.Fl TaxID=2928706 RepID=UPI00201D912F|nr:hypothetical protein [Kosakonia sp. R1.Fl]MCL6744184.1 hypothetical protein [Kosakonia sp. R1.Fl]MDU6686297.1 hypothetical protein [Enterobacteriaceae bacterium]
MTWVVGGNCFNGFVCVADIQVTIISASGRVRYFNCVQKIHQIGNNLCVAFSGDIRSGFKIIELLRENIAQNFHKDEYFDIDGQSKILIDFLKHCYNHINPVHKPYLELMFLWNSQEGDGLLYRPFCMKFKSPNFTMNSTALPGLAQSGGGIKNSTFQAITSFLEGKEISTPEYERLFSNVQGAPQIITLKNFKNIILNEASKVDQPGISRTLISFESEIPYKDIFGEQQSRNLSEAFITLGLGSTKMKTEHYSLFLSVLSIPDIQKRLDYIKRYNPFLYNSTKEIIQQAQQSINIQPLTELPPIIVDRYVSNEEEIHSYKLIATWPELKAFLGEKGIRVSAMQATA